MWLVLTLLGLTEQASSNPRPRSDSQSTPRPHVELQREELKPLAAEVQAMFNHSYSNYLAHAFPMDELAPISCKGMDTWGSYGLTQVDALDTLAVMGQTAEFERAVSSVLQNVKIGLDKNVSMFETNIRIVGGLIAGHLFAQELGITVTDADGETVAYSKSSGLLTMAIDLGQRMLPAFDTPTGIPYGTINLASGVPPGETTVTSLAGAGTYILEFGMLSRLSRNPKFEQAARGALRALWARRSKIGLVGNHIDIFTGEWVYKDSGIGPNQDSFYEYLLKAHILFGDSEYLEMFDGFYRAINTHMKNSDWYIDVNMNNGQPTLAWFTSLSGFWPGLQVLYGDLGAAERTMLKFQEVWNRFGFVPEAFDLQTSRLIKGRLTAYFLRPEMMESTMYLGQATGDPLWIELGREFVESIQSSTWTPCGYAVVTNVSTHKLGDRMESFFLSETLKYLYLLFDPDNFVHKGNFVFTTEGHPYRITNLTRTPILDVEESEHGSSCWKRNEVPDGIRHTCPRKPVVSRMSAHGLSSPPAEPVPPLTVSPIEQETSSIQQAITKRNHDILKRDLLVKIIEAKAEISRASDGPELKSEKTDVSDVHKGGTTTDRAGTSYSVQSSIISGHVTTLKEAKELLANVKTQMPELLKENRVVLAGVLRRVALDRIVAAKARLDAAVARVAAASAVSASVAKFDGIDNKIALDLAAEEESAAEEKAAAELALDKAKHQEKSWVESVLPPEPETLPSLSIAARLQFLKEQCFVIKNSDPKQDQHWTYKICFGTTVYQYHVRTIDAKKKKTEKQDLTLLGVRSTATEVQYGRWLDVKAAVDGTLGLHENGTLTHNFSNGAVCGVKDKNGKTFLRRATVTYMCDANLPLTQYRFSISEPSTCIYEFQIVTSLTCNTAPNHSHCWEAFLPDYPNCENYEDVGYYCVGQNCAATSPGGTPSMCAKLGPPGSAPDLTSGTCRVAD